jgi:hypothetical protein
LKEESQRNKKAKQCVCWSEYPNENMKHAKEWRCVDCYEPIQTLSDGKKRTICMRKEVYYG